MKKLKKNGFTLIESLFALCVSAIVAMIGIVYIQTCMNLVELKPLHQNQLAILQIRQIVSLSHDIQVDDGKLSMIYNHEEIYFEQDKNRLVQRDGYEIWMEGVQDVYFYEEDDEIYVSWLFNNQKYTSQIR